jgi:hypothetical protein
VTDADQFGGVRFDGASWWSRKKRKALRRLIAEIAWEHGDNAPATDQTMSWLRSAHLRWIATYILMYCMGFGLGILIGWLGSSFDSLLLTLVLGVVGASILVGVFYRRASYASWELGRTIIRAIQGVQGLVRNQSDADARRRALRNIVRIPPKYSTYVRRTLSGNASSRIRIARREVCRDEVLAILRLFEPTLYATDRAELVSVRDDLVRVLLRVANNDLKSIRLIGSSWPLPSMIADARNRSRWFGLESAPSGAATLIIVPLAVALIGALGGIFGNLIGK